MTIGHVSKREKYIFITAVSIIIGALLYNFVYERLMKKWNGLNIEITQKKVMLDKAIRLRGQRDDIIRAYNQYAASSKNISKVLISIEKRAYETGITLSNIKPGEAVDKGLYEEYAIELQLQGQFTDILSFLSELIKPPLFISIKKCDFRKSSEETTSIFKGTVIVSKLTL